MLSYFRRYKDVSWLFFLCGSIASFLFLAYNLLPNSFSGATALETAQKARQATLQQVNQAIMSVGDPDTTDQQIQARWQTLAQSYDAPDAIVKLAQKSCAPRTWPVELRQGRVDGTRVWVAICGWPAPLGHDQCIDSDCNAETQEINTPRNTEVVVLSDQIAPRLLAHVGREPLIPPSDMQVE